MLTDTISLFRKTKFEREQLKQLPIDVITDLFNDNFWLQLKLNIKRPIDCYKLTYLQYAIPEFFNIRNISILKMIACCDVKKKNHYQ